MKTMISKKKLVLERETISQLNEVKLDDVHGGATPVFIASLIITMLSCGFFCNPQQAR
jgi:hypothetical protein